MRNGNFLFKFQILPDISDIPSFHFNFFFHFQRDFPARKRCIDPPMYVLQAKVQSPTSSTNPFLSSPTNNANQPIVDLFGATSADGQVRLCLLFDEERYDPRLENRANQSLS